MKQLINQIVMLFVAGFLMLPYSAVLANDVEIVSAKFQQDRAGDWTVTVSLKHGDEGWNHYANMWRVVDASGNVLGERELLHPHENEQPFSRSTRGVKIPEDTKKLFVDAHDSVHGWTPNRLEIDLIQVKDGQLNVGSPD